LESAVSRPQQSVGGEDAYADIHSKAAALFESLVRNHPFIDGNKRTAVLAVAWFYAINGWWLMSTQDDLVQIALDVAEGRLKGVDAIAERLQQLSKELPD
jgi:death-on-curing protein